MKNIFKSCVSLLLVACMLLGVVPVTMLTAHAEGTKETIVYASLGDSMTNGYCLYGYDGESGGVNYAVDTYANLFAKYLAGYTGAIANDQVIFEGNKAIVDHRPLAISGMRSEDYQWVLSLDYTNADGKIGSFSSWGDTNQHPNWVANDWYNQFPVVGDYRTWNDFADAQYRYADTAAKILQVYNTGDNGKYFKSSYATEADIAAAKAGLEKDAYFPENGNEKVGTAENQFLQISTEYYQKSIADADVISVAVGNTNFGTNMLERILEVVMNGDPYVYDGRHFKASYDIERVNTQLASDPFAAAQVKGMLESKAYENIVKYCCMLAGTDQETNPVTATKQAAIKYIVDYYMSSYIYSYIGMLNKIVELNPDAKIIQIALMNAYKVKGDENIDGTMGQLVDVIYTPVNTWLKNLPATLAAANPAAYKDADFYFADAGSVSCMVDVFGNDFYNGTPDGKYPGLLNGTEGYTPNENSIVRARFVEEIVCGDQMFAAMGMKKDKSVIPSFLAGVTAYDMMTPVQKAAFAAQNAGTAKEYALYLAFENSLIRSGPENITMHSIENLGNIGSIFGQAMGGVMEAIGIARPAYYPAAAAVVAGGSNGALTQADVEAMMAGVEQVKAGVWAGAVAQGYDLVLAAAGHTSMEYIINCENCMAKNSHGDVQVDAITSAIVDEYNKQMALLPCTIVADQAKDMTGGFLTGADVQALTTTVKTDELNEEGLTPYQSAVYDLVQEKSAGLGFALDRNQAKLLGIPDSEETPGGAYQLAVAFSDGLTAKRIKKWYQEDLETIASNPDRTIEQLIEDEELNLGMEVEGQIAFNMISMLLQINEGVVTLLTPETENMLRGGVAGIKAAIDGAHSLAYLLALPQAMSDKLYNNTDLRGALTMNARVLLGTGAGGHPSAAGHASLYAAMPSRCFLGHTYAEAAENAWTWTKTEDGYTASVKLVCAENAQHTVDVDAEVKVETTAATCTDEGLKVYTATATYEGKTYTATKEETLAALEHEYNTREWKSDESGHWHECIRKDARIDFAEHVFAYDTVSGKEKCECGYLKEHVHGQLTYVEGKAATCTGAGSNPYYKCATCDTWFEDETAIIMIRDHSSIVIPAKNHNYNQPVWTWTETEDGWTAELTMVCANDKTHTVPVEGVEVTSVTTEAKCEVAGKTVYTATASYENTVYTDTKTVEIKAREHSFTTYVPNNDAVCGKDGTKTATCDYEDCDETNTVTDAGTALIHSFTKYISDENATCEKDGTKTATCDNGNCGATDTVADVDSKLGHEFTNYVSNNDATCEKDGTKTATCDRNCGAKDTVADVDSKLGHAYGETTYEWSADGKTCTAKHVCANDASHVETAAATISSTIKTVATCEGMGTTTYTAKFDVDWAADQTKDVVDIAAINHAYGAATYEWSADGKTCTAKHVCANDASHVETAAATITSAIKMDATCEDKGTTTYTAKFDAAWATVQTKNVEDIDAIGHDYVAAWVWADDYSAKLTLTCKNDASHVEEPVVTVAHETTDATCDQDGKTVYTATASFDGKTYEDSKTAVIPAGHKFGEWVTVENVSKRTCSACGYTETKTTTDAGVVEIIASKLKDGLNLIVELVIKEADGRFVLVEEAFAKYAAENGLDITILNTFDITLEDEEGKKYQPDGILKIKLPLGENAKGNFKVYWVDEDGKLTDMKAVVEDGYLVFETDHLSLYVLVDEALHAHNMSAKEAVDATCEEDGKKAYYVCDDCGKWFWDAEGAVEITDKNSVVIPALNHDWKDATCEAPKTCGNCGETEGDALGHDYNEGVCGNCGEADPDYEKPEEPTVPSTPVKPSKPNWTNIFNKWFGNWWGNGDDEEEKCDHSYKAVVTDPTCTEKGYTTHTCSKCGDSYKDSYVNALGHDYEDGKCTECGAKDPNANKPGKPTLPSWGNIFNKWFGNWWGKK